MLKRLSFLWRFRQNRFTHALAGARRGRRHSGRELWAMYRLNMYQSVARAAAVRPGWRGAFAKAVSLAACGEVSAARQAVAALRRQPGWARRRVALADALAPFMPADALHLIDGQPGVPPALHIALLLRNGRVQQARSLLDGLPPGAEQAQPELHLLRTNACGGAPALQLQRLNAFFAAHGVPPLRLRDASLPPSPANVLSGQAVVPVDGPLVTVLMTTFNTGNRAVAAVESVLAQSHGNLELIVVDDASGDDTPALVGALAARDGRVRLIRLPRNVGTYAAKRIGLAQAQGEFVTCHDSDDWAHPEKLARQLAPLLAEPGLVCTVSNWVRLQDDGLFYARPVHPLTRLNPASPLFRREPVLREAGVWDCVRTGADSEFLARLKLVFGPRAVKKVKQPLTLGSHRADSLMNAAGTGYSAGGVSPQRLAYWEAWSRWHIDALARKQRPFVPAGLLGAGGRPFAVEPALQVPAADVKACLTELKAV